MNFATLVAHAYQLIAQNWKCMLCKHTAGSQCNSTGGASFLPLCIMEMMSSAERVGLAWLKAACASRWFSRTRDIRNAPLNMCTTVNRWILNGIVNCVWTKCGCRWHFPRPRLMAPTIPIRVLWHVLNYKKKREEEEDEKTFKTLDVVVAAVAVTGLLHIAIKGDTKKS